MRAAIYARMSTDKQSADSPAGQIARCREYAARRGLLVVDALVMVDAGISGASRHDRPGLLPIMERIGEWDALLCFDASRLARDEEDFGWIVNQLEEHGRTGFEASTGQGTPSGLGWTATPGTSGPPSTGHPGRAGLSSNGFSLVAG